MCSRSNDKKRGTERKRERELRAAKRYASMVDERRGDELLCRLIEIVRVKKEWMRERRTAKKSKNMIFFNEIIKMRMKHDFDAIRWKTDGKRQTTNQRRKKPFRSLTHRRSKEEKKSQPWKLSFSRSSIIKTCKMTKSRTERWISIFISLGYDQVLSHLNHLVWSNECEKYVKILLIDKVYEQQDTTLRNRRSLIFFSLHLFICSTHLIKDLHAHHNIRKNERNRNRTSTDFNEHGSSTNFFSIAEIL